MDPALSELNVIFIILLILFVLFCLSPFWIAWKLWKWWKRRSERNRNGGVELQSMPYLEVRRRVPGGYVVARMTREDADAALMDGAERA
jgi:hypothetical protein